MIVIEEKKKSKLNAKNRFDFEKITKNFSCFIPCNYKEEEEEIIFEYDCRYVKNVSLIKKEEYINQLQFLINFSALYDCYRGYKFSFHINNLFFDENFMPCIKERDLYEEMISENEEDFLFYYKTYICAILSGKFTVMQLQECGLEIMENPDKNIQKFLCKMLKKAQ